MRVVGGRLRGRALAPPKSRAIRPTADRLRESLFNILLHAYGDPVSGARVLDLFAGTGALGIEAASRGAAFALFVDDSAEARALMRENVAALGLGGVSRIFRRDATKLGPAHPLAPFSLAFLDPPYGQGLATATLNSLNGYSGGPPIAPDPRDPRNRPVMPPDYLQSDNGRLYDSALIAHAVLSDGQGELTVVAVAHPGEDLHEVKKQLAERIANAVLH